jgi:hypothetical protein
MFQEDAIATARRNAYRSGMVHRVAVTSDNDYIILLPLEVVPHGSAVVGCAICLDIRLDTANGTASYLEC